jgi:Domain of unknown function (DUF4177)
MTWEYKTIELEMDSSIWSGKSDFPENQKLETQLNTLGLHGWELVNTIANSAYQGQATKMLFIFKRNISQ